MIESSSFLTMVQTWFEIWIRNKRFVGIGIGSLTAYDTCHYETIINYKTSQSKVKRKKRQLSIKLSDKYFLCPLST